MLPALQRLLSRPSALEFLECLIANPVSITTNRRRGIRYHKTNSPTRNRTSLSLPLQDGGKLSMNYDNGQEIPNKHNASKQQRNIETTGINLCKPWSEKSWSAEEMDFESNLYQISEVSRLLDSDNRGNDMKLWAFLLDYRQRKYGADGVAMFWETIRKRGVQIPTTGVLADKMWSIFLSLGHENPVVLEQICKYADNINDLHGQRWSKLYCRIIQQLLINGQGEAAIRWHDRLYSRYSPGPKGFGELCRQVVLWKGDMKALKSIYERHKHRNGYSKIIPVLCAREDYNTALQWHFFLLKNGDLPTTNKLVEPLVHFLAIYDRRNAVRVTKSLVNAGVSFAPSLSSNLNDNTKISREMMNLTQGQLLNLSPKTYNDKLGSRWFATNYISLDIAISSIHALGVQQIGPLSLQAIALRELDAAAVVLRINQLRELGISIGESVFSKAVERFARARESKYLEGLLNSDQHPDVLEDSLLQERLLFSYAAAEDWPQYERTLAILSGRSDHPTLEKENIILRLHAASGDRASMLRALSQMHQNGIIVKTRTITAIMKSILQRREPGRRPMLKPNRAKGSDLELAITILKQIATNGSYVPLGIWQEMIRRLGMLGQLADLENLCIFLASQYGSSDSTKSSLRQSRRYMVPTQVSPSHPLHPLRVLFSGAFQKAVISWGFIHALKAKPQHPFNPASPRNIVPFDKPPSPDVSFGITLLKRLHDRGVNIELGPVKKAIFLRLVAYYGPARSNKRYNRQAINALGLNSGIDRDQSLEQMAAQIDEALDARVFTGVNLPELIAARAERTQRKLRRKDQRLLAKSKSEAYHSADPLIQASNPVGLSS